MFSLLTLQLQPLVQVSASPAHRAGLQQSLQVVDCLCLYCLADTYLKSEGYNNKFRMVFIPDTPCQFLSTTLIDG